MSTTVVAILHHGHAAAGKMGKAAEAFWRPGMYRQKQEKKQEKKTGRAAGKNN